MARDRHENNKEAEARRSYLASLSSIMRRTEAEQVVVWWMREVDAPPSVGPTPEVAAYRNGLAEGKRQILRDLRQADKRRFLELYSIAHG